MSNKKHPIKDIDLVLSTPLERGLRILAENQKLLYDKLEKIEAMMDNEKLGLDGYIISC